MMVSHFVRPAFAIWGKVIGSIVIAAFLWGGAPIEAAKKKKGKDEAAVTHDSSLSSFTGSSFESQYVPRASGTTLIENVTLFDGVGGKFTQGSVLIKKGKIEYVGGKPADGQRQNSANVSSSPFDFSEKIDRRIDGSGKFLTPGIIDVHSHMGNAASPVVAAHNDYNDLTTPVASESWTEHGVWPQDPAFGLALEHGGITTMQILPGSANLFGGRSVVLRNVPAVTVQQMKFPGAAYGLKMACGENPKRFYGEKGRAPSTRMSNLSIQRQTWINAHEYRRKRTGDNPPKRNLRLETLADVLDGKIYVHQHCYRADDMAQIIGMSKEFGYKVAAFHHAVEAYKITDILQEEGVCIATWADWWGFKMEAYDSVVENAAFVDQAGACAIIHSDSSDEVQRLNQEAAKVFYAARRLGMKVTEGDAMRWLTYNAAKALGIEKETGSLEVGKRADIVLWNKHPFSVYARPEKVWIDGAVMFDAYNQKALPVSDFELGQGIAYPKGGRQ